MRSRCAGARALLLLLVVSPAIAQEANAAVSTADTSTGSTQSESTPMTITETVTTTTTSSSSSSSTFTRSSITTFDLAPTGTGSLYAAQCNSNWQAYITSSIDYAGEVSILATSSWTYHNLSAQLTTLCDGDPRVVGALTTLATGTNSSVYYQFQNYTAPTPTCSINPSDCADLNAAYSQAYNDTAMSSSSLDLQLTLAAGATALTIANDFSTVTTTFAGPITTPPILTIGGSAWTANADSQYILSPVNGTFVDTLTPNGTALYIPSIPFTYWDLESVCTRTQASECGRCAIYGGQVRPSATLGDRSQDTNVRIRCN
nr:hypothetical protein CFP56_19689 [Quercus suber]